ncbi:MAG: SpoIID/LytB domain-containing protein [Microgenomates group bacterium]
MKSVKWQVLGIKKLIFQVLFIGLTIGFLSLGAISAEPNCDNPGPGDYDYCYEKIDQEIQALRPAHEYNKKELADLKTQLNSLEKRIAALSSQLRTVERDISLREEDLGFAQEIFEIKTNSYYKFLRLYDPLLPFLSSNNASEVFREINFRQRAADEDRRTMEKYAEDLLALRNDKEELERNKTNLAAAQRQVDERAKFLEGEVEKVETYLATLTAKQQAILAAKSGAFIVSVGDSELADDYNASIKGFREAAPSGSFAVFSFGAYTHRKGMSQYGARGRANSGRNYKDILQTYYGKQPVNKNTDGTINVESHGALDFENYYLFGIAEMPSTWHPEALKAQAVAARTYAYRYKQDGSTICITERCQVFRQSKADNPPEAWKQAVINTKGEVLEDVVTFYSSTTGGYLTTMGWDTTDGSGGGSFLDKTYEKLGGSPWVYKAWYTEGYSPSSDKCGRSNPWLSGTELADIVNAALVFQHKDDDRITPVTTSCWGGNPYSHEELRNVAAQYGGISTVSSVYVTQGGGATNEVVVNGNIHLSGSEFKQAFNLRAPGYLMIPQKGFAFFNIEKK